MTIAETLLSGHGAWHPLVWILAIVLVWGITVLIRSFGNKNYKPGTSQTDPFLSGDAVDPADLHIKASNLYWGFIESMKGYYRILMRVHTGEPGDYILWFLGITVIIFLTGFLT